MVLFWYIFIPKVEHFLPGVANKNDHLPAGHFGFQKSPLYNTHNKCSNFRLFFVQYTHLTIP